MKVSATSAFIGWTVGLVALAFYLTLLLQIGVGRQQTFFMMAPAPGGEWPLRGSWLWQQQKLALLWEFQRTALIATLLGIPLPAIFAAVAGIRYKTHDSVRWQTQCLLVGVNLVALPVIVRCIGILLR